MEFRSISNPGERFKSHKRNRRMFYKMFNVCGEKVVYLPNFSESQKNNYLKNLVLFEGRDPSFLDNTTLTDSQKNKVIEDLVLFEGGDTSVLDKTTMLESQKKRVLFERAFFKRVSVCLPLVKAKIVELEKNKHL